MNTSAVVPTSCRQQSFFLLYWWESTWAHEKGAPCRESGHTVIPFLLFLGHLPTCPAYFQARDSNCVTTRDLASPEQGITTAPWSRPKSRACNGWYKLVGSRSWSPSLKKCNRRRHNNRSNGYQQVGGTQSKQKWTDKGQRSWQPFLVCSRHFIHWLSGGPKHDHGSVWRELGKASTEKHPGNLPQEVLLHNFSDQASPQTSLSWEFHGEIIRHPPCNPSLAPSDFFLFPNQEKS